MTFNGPPADQPGSAQGVRGVDPTELAMAAVGIQDPTPNLYSPSFANLNATLQQGVNDGISEIVQGRRPVGDLDQVIADWRTKGGDKIRGEFQDALAATK